MEVSEENGDVTFLHKVMDGPVDKSYGINVAKLANLPESVITRANELLEYYESKDSKKTRKVQQLSLNFDNEVDELREYIKTINPYEVTPIEAINILDQIKKKI